MSFDSNTDEPRALQGCTVLIVEDDDADARSAADAVKMLGGASLRVDTVQSARAAIADGDINLVILDRMLADSEDGLALLQWFRDVEMHPPGVLGASRLTTTDDHIRGLDLGADDYVNKPYERRALAARLRALRRRTEAVRAPQSVRIWGGLEMRTLNGVALWRGEKIDLRPQSFKVLDFLALHRGDHVSREALWRGVWVEYKNLPPQDTVINTAINRLRKSLNAFDKPAQIVSEDLGYRLVVE